MRKGIEYCQSMSITIMMIMWYIPCIFKCAVINWFSYGELTSYLRQIHSGHGTKSQRYFWEPLNHWLLFQRDRNIGIANVITLLSVFVCPCVGTPLCTFFGGLVSLSGVFLYCCLPLFFETGFLAIPGACYFVQGSPVCFFSPGITDACCHILVDLSTEDLNTVLMLVH